jgi:hypothetical protein
LWFGLLLRCLIAANQYERERSQCDGTYCSR